MFFLYLFLSPALAAQNTDSYIFLPNFMTFVVLFWTLHLNLMVDSQYIPVFVQWIPFFLWHVPTFFGSIMDINSWTFVRWSISVENFHGHGFVCCRLNILNPRSFGDLRASFFFVTQCFCLLKYYYMLYCIAFLQTITVHSWIILLDIEDIHDLFVWSRPSWKIHSKS